MCATCSRGLLTLFVISIIGSPLVGQEWSRFRGPNGSGLAVAGSIPAEWTEDDFKWKTELPGKGHSSPVLWGERIFLMSGDPDKATQYVLCLSVNTGQILWGKEFGSLTHTLHERNTYASSTPAVDADRIYVAWSNPSRVTLMALTHSGQEVWTRDLGPWTSQHGFGTSPMLFNDLLILSNSQQAKNLKANQKPGESRVMAFETESGESRWETVRTSMTVCYSTPVIYRPTNGRPQLINTSTGEGFYSLDPETGKENWRVGEAFEMRTVSSPVIAGDVVFGSTGSGGGGNYVAAIRIADQPKLMYEIRQSAPYVPTIVAKDGLAFLYSDKGIVTCVKIDSGEVLWRERVGIGFSGSPVIVDDKVFCIGDEGTVYVLAVSKEFELLAENPLNEPSRSTPAVAGGRIYLRTESHLHSIGR